MTTAMGVYLFDAMTTTHNILTECYDHEPTNR